MSVAPPVCFFLLSLCSICRNLEGSSLFDTLSATLCISDLSVSGGSVCSASRSSCIFLAVVSVLLAFRWAAVLAVASAFRDISSRWICQCRDIGVIAWYRLVAACRTISSLVGSAKKSSGSSITGECVSSVLARSILLAVEVMFVLLVIALCCCCCCCCSCWLLCVASGV